MEWLNDPQIWASLLTLTALEIVLGIENLVFITILAGRLPADRQNRARQSGLALALVSRLALLGSIAWIVGLTQPLFQVLDHTVSWQDLILMGAASSCSTRAREIHHRLYRYSLGPAPGLMARRSPPRLAHFRRAASVSDRGAARLRTGGHFSRLVRNPRRE